MLSPEDFSFFAKVARSPSLAAAARTMNVTAPAVSQRLAALERRLGFRLLSRAAGKFDLTNEGQILADRAAAILSQMESAADELAALRGQLSGPLKIVAPFGFGRRYVSSFVAQFSLAHPLVSCELMLTDRISQVTGSAWDVAIHIGQMREGALIARKVATNRRYVCAAPNYLERCGAPAVPEDVLHHACLSLQENDEDATLWRFERDGQTTAVRVKPVLSSNDGEVLQQWALEGRGLIVRSEWSVAGDLAAGRLKKVLGDFTFPDANILALTRSRQDRSMRVSAFVDFLSDAMKPPPWAQQADTAAQTPDRI